MIVSKPNDKKGGENSRRSQLTSFTGARTCQRCTARPVIHATIRARGALGRGISWARATSRTCCNAVTVQTLEVNRRLNGVGWLGDAMSQTEGRSCSGRRGGGGVVTARGTCEHMSTNDGEFQNSKI